MIDVQAEINIAAPRTRVAEFMFDPKHDRLWIGGLTNVFPLTSGKLKKGAKVERTGRFMNREFTSTVIVITDKPGQSLEMSADEPFEMLIKYELSDSSKGTIVKIRIKSVGEIPFNAPASIVSKAVLDNLVRDLKSLKRLVEQSL